MNAIQLSSRLAGPGSERRRSWTGWCSEARLTRNATRFAVEGCQAADQRPEQSPQAARMPRPQRADRPEQVVVDGAGEPRKLPRLRKACRPPRAVPGFRTQTFEDEAAQAGDGPVCQDSHGHEDDRCSFGTANAGDQQQPAMTSPSPVIVSVHSPSTRARISPCTTVAITPTTRNAVVARSGPQPKRCLK